MGVQFRYRTPRYDTQHVKHSVRWWWSEMTPSFHEDELPAVARVATDPDGRSGYLLAEADEATLKYRRHRSVENLPARSA